MNCLEFRRRLMTDPFDADPALGSHEDRCQDCAGFARELRAEETRLRSMLQNITPPEGLAERIQMAARFEQGASTRRRVWYGAAASVLLAVVVSLVSVTSTFIERSQQALAQSVIHHIEDEANHLHEAHPVSDGRLKWVFRRFNAELVDDLGRVNFAAECLMRNRNGVHLVMPGEVGPITVFFMPGERVADTTPVRSARFEGEILPTHWGSIAVVGESGETLGGLGERLAAAVAWPGGATAGLSSVERLLGLDLGLRIAMIAQQQDG